ncbi:MAG: quinone-dependent dihydroorotate dehydrogenase [Burkholderiales bacterium]
MIYSLLRPLLFCLDAETAHDLSLNALKRIERLGLAGLYSNRIAAKPVQVMGLSFPNRVGLAAGLDKNGDYIDALAAMGFGHLEIGTVTPHPQPGNPQPRMFRLAEANAIINRMGFNNDGVEKLVANVQRAKFKGILGINIGKNADTPIERAAEDYLRCLRKVYVHASYITVNISSPNTKNLRQLQQGDALEDLLRALTQEREQLTRLHGKRIPLALKIAPDLTPQQIEQIAALLVEFGIDAVIATNTTLGRDGVQNLRHGNEAGGLSGAPVTEKSTAVIRELSRYLPARVAIIGVGGIFSAQDAQKKIDAGASLVQIYSGLIYRGPQLVKQVGDALC